MPPVPYTDNFIPENYYHIFNHAVGSDLLFRNENNYNYFLKKLKHYIIPVCDIYCYCLMPNHFHILLKIKSENKLLEVYKNSKKDSIVTELDFHKIVMNQFKYMLNGYAQAYNKMYSRKGSLFIDYLRRKQISDNHYFTKIIHYIHNNPVHHGFCKSIEEWSYSSFHTIISQKATSIQRAEVIKWFGSSEKYILFHQDNSQIKEIEL